MANVRIENLGLWSSKQECWIEEIAWGSSRMSAGSPKGAPCHATTLDEYVCTTPEQRCDMIKLDIEGAEIECLKGAMNVIRKYRPKLQISIYHHPSHYLDIPLLLLHENLGYTFYMGHHMPWWTETCLYALPAAMTPELQKDQNSNTGEEIGAVSTPAFITKFTPDMSLINQESFSGLALRHYQLRFLISFQQNFSFMDKDVLELGSDLGLQTAKAILICGARSVWAANPLLRDIGESLPDNLHPLPVLGENTGLPDQSIDVIFGIALLEQVSAPDKLAAECRRLLKPGGVCFLQGNPLWTSWSGHHTWIVKDDVRFLFTDKTTPFEPWEHLTLKTDAAIAKTLSSRGVPETCIPEIAQQVLHSSVISRLLFREIVAPFAALPGMSVLPTLLAATLAPRTNRFYYQALNEFNADDLRNDEVQIVMTHRSHPVYQSAPTGMCIVPLGYTNFPALYLSNNRMRPMDRSSVFLTLFECANAPVDAVIEAIQTDFSGYADIRYDKDSGYWIGAKQTHFNQDRDIGPDGHDVLLQRLRQRIANFRAIMRSDEPCVFVFSTYMLGQSCKDAVLRLYNTLLEQRRHRPFLLLVWGDQSDLLELPSQIKVVACAYPFTQNERWWVPDVMNSHTGKEFQKNLITATQQFIERFCEKFSLMKKKPIIAKLPNFVRIDASTLCQLNCTACYMRVSNSGTVGKGNLKFSDFKNFIDTHPYIKRVELSNNGEIFLNPDLIKILAYAFAQNVQLSAINGVNFNTVSDEVIEALVKYRFLAMTFSIDGASQKVYSAYRRNGNYDKVICNIKKLNEFKNKYKSKFPETVWQYVVRENTEDDVINAKKQARQLGMDVHFKLTWEQEYKPQKIEILRAETGLFKQNFPSHVKLASNQPSKDPRTYYAICHQLFESPQINWDGRLLGCCRVHRSDFGVNVFEVGLEAALNTEQYTYAKQLLQGKCPPPHERLQKIMPCVTCDYYRQMVKENNFLKIE
jgi:SAM-dependent methyltransferase/molybdenum cofactor biosynthesis enzyme MoaA